MSQLSIMFVAIEIKQTLLRKFSEVFFYSPFNERITRNGDGNLLDMQCQMIRVKKEPTEVKNEYTEYKEEFSSKEIAHPLLQPKCERTGLVDIKKQENSGNDVIMRLLTKSASKIEKLSSNKDKKERIKKNLKKRCPFCKNRNCGE